MNCYCTQCGKLLQYPYLFCSNCGAKNHDPPVKIQEYGFENQDKQQVKIDRVNRYFTYANLKALFMCVIAFSNVGILLYFFSGFTHAFEILLFLLLSAIPVTMTIISIKMIVTGRTRHAHVKEDILSEKNPFNNEDKNDKIVYEYEETLPFPEPVLYDACIRASIHRFQYPCCGVPYRKIYAGWACVARDGIIGKVYIYLTPVSNGTRLRLHCAYFDQVHLFRKKPYTDSLHIKLYARGFVDLIRNQVQYPVQ